MPFRTFFSLLQICVVRLTYVSLEIILIIPQSFNSPKYVILKLCFLRFCSD